jgi:DNA-binding response OmpR family regulator
MSLARGEKPDSALVIAVASTVEERLRVVRLVDEQVSLLLVGTREEAAALLLADDDVGLAPVPDPPMPVVAAVADLTVDSDLRIASYEGASVALSPLEHDLLRCLLDDVGHTWPFEVLHREIWGTGHLGGLADVQSVVKRLRRKLRDLRCPLRITAVRGVGLRLDRRLVPAR